MNIRKTIAATLAAGTLIVGIGATSGAAFADTTTTSTPAHRAPLNKRTACGPRVKARLAGLEKRHDVDGKLEKRIQDRIDTATAAGKTGLAAHLQARLDKVKKADARLVTMIDKLTMRCAAPSASPTTPTTAAQ